MGMIDCYFIGQIARVQREFTESDVERWSLFTGHITKVKRTFAKDDADRFRSFTKEKNKGFEHDISMLYVSRPFVPGILSEGLITEAISKELPGAPCVIMQKEMVFIQPVHVGNTVTTEVEIIDVNVKRNWITEKVRCVNELGIELIKGQIILKLL